MKTLYEASPPTSRRRVVVATPQLARIVEELASKDTALLVRELARELSSLFAHCDTFEHQKHLKRSSTTAALEIRSQPPRASHERLRRVTGEPTIAGSLDGQGLPKPRPAALTEQRSKNESFDAR